MSMSEWLEEKMLKVKEFGEAVTGGFTTDENAEARYAICRTCEHYGIKTSGNKLLFEKGCNSCLCYLPVKTLMRDAKCPEGYWPKGRLEDVERLKRPDGKEYTGFFGEGKYED